MSKKSTPFRIGHRKATLEQRQGQKMARSAHTYLRGSTLKFYEWLESSTGKLLPQGPAVWICGDCHIGNLGPVANTEGEVQIAIRDLDQTVVGNPAHDLVRLALSLATAIRSSDLSGITTALMLEEMIQGYDDGLRNRRNSGEHSSAVPKEVRRVLRKALKRRWHDLAEERIQDVTPVIPLGECFWKLSQNEKKLIHEIFADSTVRNLITSLTHRDEDDKVQVVDAAYWVKGCSSLGRLRFAVLVEIGKKKHRTGEFCLIDIKEAVRAAAPRYANALMPRDNADRVVEGARKLSPFLGQRMLSWRFADRPVVLRELLPQDLKLKMDQLTPETAIASARFLASVVGNAHGSQMNGEVRRTWLADLRRDRSRKLKAPSWLWKSVVELMAIHEAAYLDYCRISALRTA